MSWLVVSKPCRVSPMTRGSSWAVNTVVDQARCSTPSGTPDWIPSGWGSVDAAPGQRLASVFSETDCFCKIRPRAQPAAQTESSARTTPAHSRALMPEASARSLAPGKGVWSVSASPDSPCLEPSLPAHSIHFLESTDLRVWPPYIMTCEGPSPNDRTGLPIAWMPRAPRLPAKTLLSN